MNGLVVGAAWAGAAINALAALWGGWCWRRFAYSAAFWALVRAGQAAALVFAALVGVLALAGHHPDDGVFWVYVLVPLGVSFVAEQFRVLSARTVLDARELEDAQAMRALPEREQRWIVTLIQRRETGVMALGALAIAFLLARGALTATGF